MIDVTDATFEAEVIERSDQVPVVVDLWAPWCGPCRTLGPILEQVIAGTDGKVLGVKVNVDENPGIAQAFQAQSIPLVVALKDRKVVSSFLGAQPEAAVREFVEALAPSEADQAVAALIEAGDETSLRQALDLDPTNEPATLALAGLLAVDRGEEALALLAKLPDTPEARHIAALARHGDEADADVPDRLEQLLDRVKADDDARQEFLDLLELLGPEDPRTAEYRKKLAAHLY